MESLFSYAGGGFHENDASTPYYYTDIHIPTYYFTIKLYQEPVDVNECAVLKIHGDFTHSKPCCRLQAAGPAPHNNRSPRQHKCPSCRGRRCGD